MQFLLFLLTTGIKVKIYEFEGLFDPSYLNLDQNDPNAWKTYAEKVRDIIAKCLKIPKVNQSKLESDKFKSAYLKCLKKI